MHQDSNGFRAESEGKGRNNGGVQREAQSGDGRDDVLYKRGKSSKSGNVLVESEKAIKKTLKNGR